MLAARVRFVQIEINGFDVTAAAFLGRLAPLTVDPVRRTGAHWPRHS